LTSLLPKTKNRRKNRIVILRAELFRERGAGEWRLAIRYDGKRTAIFDTYTSIEAAAREYARATIRYITRVQPAASSQQPAASSQQPAASSQQPANANLI
jgi:hypothetical protein